MKKNNMVKLLGIALVVAIISTGVFYGLFVNKLSSNTGSGKLLVVAAKPLRPGTVIVPEDLKTIPWPAAAVPKGTFENFKSVVGKTVFDNIGEDEPILYSRLISEDPGKGTGSVPPGMRAVSVHVSDSSGVLALLHPGQKVDVQVVVNRKQSPSDTEVRTVLENLDVLSVRPQLELNSQGQNLPVVTLVTTPAGADALAAADSGARVRLTLRNPADELTTRQSKLALDTVMGDAVIARPPAPVQARAPIAPKPTVARIDANVSPIN